MVLSGDICLSIRKEVLRFLAHLSKTNFTSEIVIKYKKRFDKSGAKMFTFLDYDGCLGTTTMRSMQFIASQDTGEMQTDDLPKRHWQSTW